MAYLLGTVSVWAAFILIALDKACGWPWANPVAIALLLVSAICMLMFGRAAAKQLARMVSRTEQLLDEELVRLETELAQRSQHEPLS